MHIMCFLSSPDFEQICGLKWDLQKFSIYKQKNIYITYSHIKCKNGEIKLLKEAPMTTFHNSEEHGKDPVIYF